MNAVKNDGNPLHTTCDLIRLVVDSLRLGEQDLDVGNTMLKNRLTKAADTRCVRENGLHIAMGQNSSIVGLFIKNVELHYVSFFIEIGMFHSAFLILEGGANNGIHGVLLLLGKSIEDVCDGFLIAFVVTRFRIVVGMRHLFTLLIFESSADYSIDSILLLLGKSIEDIGNGFFLLAVFFLFFLFRFTIITVGMRHLFALLVFESGTDNSIDSILLLLRKCVEYVFYSLFIVLIHNIFSSFDIVFVSMLEISLARTNNSFVIDRLVRSIAMRKRDIVDRCSGIRPGKDKTNFSNHPMHNIVALLTKMIGVDGERPNVAMTHQFSCCLASGSGIERTIRVHAIITFL